MTELIRSADVAACAAVVDVDRRASSAAFACAGWAGARRACAELICATRDAACAAVAGVVGNAGVAADAAIAAACIVEAPLARAACVATSTAVGWVGGDVDAGAIAIALVGSKACADAPSADFRGCAGHTARAAVARVGLGGDASIATDALTHAAAARTGNAGCADRATVVARAAVGSACLKVDANVPAIRCVRAHACALASDTRASCAAASTACAAVAVAGLDVQAVATAKHGSEWA